MMHAPFNSDSQHASSRKRTLNRCKSKCVLAVTLFLVAGLSESIATEREFGPWSSARAFPTVAPGETFPEEEKSGGYVSNVFFGWLRIYQNRMNVVMRSQCPMTPSCSAYSIEAIKKHGAVKGLVLTFDRLIHEADEKATGYKVMRGNRLKALDPVTNNDFWWHK